MIKTDKKNRLGELDALRGLAALMVVTFHLSMPFTKDISASNVLRFGILGVDLFFMISGFAISMSINNIKTGRDFIVNRFARLYPVYWVCLCLSFLLQLYHVMRYVPGVATKHLVKVFLVNISMLQYYTKAENMEDPYWSLIIELNFYLIVFLIYKLKRLKNIEAILFILALIQLSALLAGYFYTPVFTNKLFALTSFLPLLHYLPLFLIGVVFYKVYTEKWTAFRVTIILVCYIQQLMEYGYRPALKMFNTTQWHYAIVIGVFIVLFYLFTNNLLSVIVNKVTLFLGRISYALYLFHQYLLLFVLVPFYIDTFHISYLMSSLVSLGIAIGVAAIITIYFDEPARVWVKKKLRKV